MKPHWVVEYISFVCRHCKAPFEKAADLVEHKRSSHPQELLYYPLPPSVNDKSSYNETTRSKAKLGGAVIPLAATKLKRTQISEKRTVYLCQHCKEKLPSFDDLLEHKLALHPELTPYLGDYSCQMCHSRYTDQRNYGNHMLNHKAKLRLNADFPCSSCGMRFLTDGAQKAHISQHHSVDTEDDVSSNDDVAVPTNDLVCRFCAKTLPHSFALRQHLRRMHGSDVLEKKVVDDEFYAPDDLSNSDEEENSQGSCQANGNFSPVITDIQGGRFSCTFCERQLRSVSELTEHERTHTGERPYLCRLCGKGFARARALSAHQRDHPPLDGDVEGKPAPYQPTDEKVQPSVKSKLAVPPLLAIKSMPQLKLQSNVLAQQAVKKLSDIIQSTGTVDDRRKGVYGQNGPGSHMIQNSAETSSNHNRYPENNGQLKKTVVPAVVKESFRRSSSSAMSFQDVVAATEINAHRQSESFQKMLAQQSHRKIYCKICNKHFPTFEMLLNHRKYKHPHLMRKSGEYRCNICHTVNTDRDTFSRHVKTHKLRMEQGTDFPCELCDKRFLSQNKLDLHLSEHHPDAVEDEVEQKSANEFALQECQGNDDIMPSYQFSSIPSHLVKNTRCERRLIQCRLCDYIARGNQAWKEHERLHTGERPYPCRVCGKRFNRLRNRRSHERGVHRLRLLPQSSSHRESSEGTHEANENDFLHESQADVDEQKDSSVLQLHQVKPPSYGCTFCNFHFTTLNALLTHLKSCKSKSSRSTANQRLPKVSKSKSKKLYSCSHCDQEFTSRGALFYHKAKVHREHRIQCPQCEASYVLESQLQTHLKTKHGLDLDENELMEYVNSEANDEMIPPETFVQVSLDSVTYLDDGDSLSMSPQSQDEEPVQYESEEASRAAAFFGVLNLKPRKSLEATIAAKNEISSSSN